MATPRPDPHTDDLLAQAPWVRRLARALVRDEHLAEDVSQEVLAAALDRPPSGLVDARRLRAWLAGVTRRRAARATGREALRSGVEQRAARPESGGEGPHAALERLATHRRLVEAVMALDPAQREAVTLRYFDDLAPREVARRLGIRPEAARQRVHRAVVALRARLAAEDEERGESGAWCVLVGGLVGESGRAPVALAEATRILGGPVMGTKKLVAAAALMALGGWAAVVVAREFVEPSAAEQSTERAAVVPVASPPSSDTDLDSSDIAPAADGSSSRSAVPHEAAGAVVLEADDGTSLEGARVLWMAGQELHEVLADSNGVARPDAKSLGDRALDAWRSGPRFAIAVGRAAVEVKDDRAVLARCFTFDARLVVEDGARGLEAPHALAWSADEDTTEAWPYAVRVALALDSGNEIELGLDGAFRVSRLRPDESGALVLPRTHVWTAEQTFGRVSDWDERRLDLAPGDVTSGRERIVRVRALTTVRGALAWPGGEPAAGASVELRVGLEGSWNQARARATTDDEGRFVVGVAPVAEGEEIALSRRSVLPVSNVELRVHGLAGAEPMTVERSFDPPVHAADLGLSLLAPARRVDLRVVDGDERPIAGALAASAQRRGEVTGPWKSFGRSGGDGLLELRPDADHDVVAVGADGFAVAIVPLVPHGDGARTVVLERAPRLELRVEVDGGPPPSDLAPRIEHGPGVWGGATPGGSPTAVHCALARLRGSSTTASGGTIELEPSLASNGRWTVGGLAAGVPLRVVVHGRHGDELAGQDVAPLAAGEVRRVTLELDAPTFVVRGRVVDDQGAPVPQARVTLRRASGDSYGTRTSTAGEWRVGGYTVDGELVDVRVEREGFVPLDVEGVVLRRDGAPIELRVAPGAPFLVYVERADGARAEGMTVRATLASGTELRALRSEDGVTHRLGAVPPGPFVVWTRHAGRRYAADVRGADAEATIALPPHGSVRVEIDPAFSRAGERGFLQVALEAIEGEPAATHHSFPAPRVGRRPMAPVQELVPGRYRVVAKYRPRGAPMDGSADELLGMSEVTVVAGEEVTTRVGRPKVRNSDGS